MRQLKKQTAKASQGCNRAESRLSHFLLAHESCSQWNYEELCAEGNPKGQGPCVLELGELQQTMSVTSRPLADDPLPILVYRRGADGRLPILVGQLKKTNCDRIPRDVPAPSWRRRWHSVRRGLFGTAAAATPGAASQLRVC